MILTSDAREFGQELRAGDILVFDSLSAVSGLIQWADDAPANHVALMLDAKTAIEANLGASPKSAVHRLPVAELTALTRVRGVLAMRHPDLAPGSAPLLRVIERAESFERRATRFSVAELALLCPSALLRSYDRPGANPLPDGVARRILVAALQLSARQALRRLPDDAESLVCSEFVYRCFAEAGVLIDVPDALGPRSVGGTDWDEDTLAAEEEMWVMLRRRNALVARGEGEGDVAHASLSEGTQADRVTPGDLWRSPTLAPVAQLAKPRPQPPSQPQGQPVSE